MKNEVLRNDEHSSAGNGVKADVISKVSKIHNVDIGESI